MINDSMIEDAQILEFACRWLPFGGGEPVDLMVDFGMTPASFAARLARILEGPVAAHLEPELRSDLRRHCINAHKPFGSRSTSVSARSTTARRSAV